MRTKHLIWFSAFGLVTATAATPAAAQWFWPNPPSFSYQGPDGTYESPAGVVRAVTGTPCGIECSGKAARRWGLIPNHRPPYGDPYYKGY